MRRYTRPFGAVLVALVLAFSVAAGAAQAQPRPELSAETLIEAARAALAEDKLDDAEFLLKGVRPGEGDIDDLDFLHGTIAAKRGEWQEAIRPLPRHDRPQPRSAPGAARPRPGLFPGGRGRQRRPSFPPGAGNEGPAPGGARPGACLPRPHTAAQELVDHRVAGGPAGQQHQRRDQRPAGRAVRPSRRRCRRMRARPAASG